MDSLFSAASYAVSATAAAPVQAGALVGGAAQRTTGMAMNKVSVKKEMAKALLLDMAKPLRDSVMQRLRAVVFGTMLDDPDMKPDMKKYLTETVELLWAEIQAEIESSIESAMLAQRENAIEKGPEGGLFSVVWLRVRRWMLYHYLPFDKSIFGKFKDPVYLGFFAATCLPIHGLRIGIFIALLLFLRFPGPADEFQMLNYVVCFKGYQFLSGGYICMATAGMTYYSCYCQGKDKMLECMDSSGPGGYPVWGEAVDYLGSIILPWIAIMLLRGTKKYAKVEFLGRNKAKTPQQADTNAAGNTAEVLPEDRTAMDSIWLRRLIFWDIKCFTFSIGVLVVGSLLSCDSVGSNQFATNVFWCRVLYSMLTFPWTMFAIPATLQLLTHCCPTGYNHLGACVPFAIRVAPEPPKPRRRARNIPGEDNAAEAGCLGGAGGTGAAGDGTAEPEEDEEPEYHATSGAQYGQVNAAQSLLCSYDRF